MQDCCIGRDSVDHGCGDNSGQRFIIEESEGSVEKGSDRRSLGKEAANFEFPML